MAILSARARSRNKQRRADADPHHRVHHCPGLVAVGIPSRESEQSRGGFETRKGKRAHGEMCSILPLPSLNQDHWYWGVMGAAVVDPAGPLLRGRFLASYGVNGTTAPIRTENF
jgi:hypothetical protein